MKIKYFIPFCFVCLMGACTDLEERFYSETGKEDFFANEQLLTLYSGRAYQTLQSYCTEQSLWTLNLQTADECAIPVNSVGEWKQTRYIELQTHNFVISNKLIRTGWDFCFNGIAACNDVIYQTEISPIQFKGKNRILAEMKVLRAFYYFMAIDGWGNIPFSIDPSDKSNPPQKDRKFIFSFIEKEITENINQLEVEVNQASYGRITQGVANALLAKLYLNAEEWIGEAHYDKAEQACAAVVNSGRYSIEDNYKANFEVYNENSKENIFVIPYSTIYMGDNYDYSFLIYLMALESDNCKIFNISAGVWDGFVCQPDFFASYDEHDKRRSDTWLYGQQYDVSRNEIPGLIIEPLFDESKYETGRSTNEGARLWKWTYQTDGKLTYTSMENDFALFRYADVLLMYAEALLRQGKPAGELVALPDFVKIRTRAGLTPFTTGDLTLDALFLERGHELAWEGWRRQDLIRFGKFNEAWWAKPASSVHTKLYPIPLERRASNPNLNQNPGYNE